jgi:hypothetical protein
MQKPQVMQEIIRITNSGRRVPPPFVAAGGNGSAIVNLWLARSKSVLTTPFVVRNAVTAIAPATQPLVLRLPARACGPRRRSNSSFANPGSGYTRTPPDVAIDLKEFRLVR